MPEYDEYDATDRGRGGPSRAGEWHLKSVCLVWGSGRRFEQRSIIITFGETNLMLR